MSRDRGGNDRLRTLVAAPLRIGTAVAVGMVALGLALTLAGPQMPEPDAGAPLIEVIAGGGPPAVVSIGLLLLTLVPLGVAIGTVIGFWRTGERRYLIGSIVVAVLLVASLLVSLLVLARP